MLPKIKEYEKIRINMLMIPGTLINDTSNACERLEKWSALGL